MNSTAIIFNIIGTVPPNNKCFSKRVDKRYNFHKCGLIKNSKNMC